MKVKAFINKKDPKDFTKQEKKEYKEYLNWWGDIEYKKYLKRLDNAKDGFEENNKEKVEYNLMLASMQLKLVANIRTRKV